MVISNIYIMNITKFEGGDFFTFLFIKIQLTLICNIEDAASASEGRVS